MIAVIVGSLAPALSAPARAVSHSSEKPHLAVDLPVSIASQQRLRAHLHLESDSSWIKAVSDKYQVDQQYGIALSPDERKTLDDSLKATKVNLAAEEFATQLQIYGGSYQETTGVHAVHLFVTRALSTAEASVLSRLTEGIPVIVSKRDVSYEDLKSLVYTITKSKYWDLHYIVSAEPNSETAQVDVGVLKSAPSEVSKYLSETFAPNVNVVPVEKGPQADLSRDITTGSMSGGQWVFFQNTGNCTVGWSHVRNAQGAGGYYSLTAGHCARSGKIAYRGKDGAMSVGSMGSQNPVGPGVHVSCDCKQFGPIPSSGVPANTVLNPRNEKQQLTGTSGTAANALVCHSGAATAEYYGIVQCGNVVARDASYQEYVGDPNGTYYFTLTDADRVDVDVQAGDSGGPVYSGYDLYGIVSGEQIRGEDVSMVYSEISNVLPVARVTVKFGAF